MITLFRWLIRLILGAFALIALVFGVTYYLASRSLPEYTAEHRVAGISARVEIVRNTANVPHIFGETDADVFFALGLAHAQDRLWQMTLLRRTAKGRLSELFGEKTLESDILMRRLDLYNAASISVQAQSPEVLAMLEAYSDGVNAWVRHINQDARGRGAPEFFLFPPQITPWQPADSIALMKLLAAQMATQSSTEVLRARTSLMVSDERLRDLMPDAPGAATVALPSFATLFSDLPKYAAALPDSTYDPMNLQQPAILSGASNAWAAAASRSATGSTLLANDPHFTLSAPSLWYLARMELSSGGIIGATVPGVPAILSGRSDVMGWGIAASHMDDLDFYMEQINPDNDAEFLSTDGYRPFTTRPSIIPIKDADPVRIELRWTDNGPVLPEGQYQLDTITPRGHVPSVAWSMLDPADTTLTGAINIMRADSLENALAAGADFMTPSVNLTVADQNRIAMKTLGAMPLRDVNHQSKGRIPSQGWLPENRWNGYADYSENPAFFNPEGGIIGVTNNKVTNRDFPYHMSFEWGDTQRINRWQRLMQNREVHTRESFIEAQLDTVSFSAQSLLPLVGADLWFTGEAAEIGTPERLRQDALNLLSAWNGDMNEHLPEPLIYATWMLSLEARLIRDELGPLSREFTHVEPLFVERVFRDIDGASAWCDVVQSTQKETCADISRVALDDALLWLSELYGRDVESWRWGDAHQATHDHAILGKIPVLRWFVNIRQSTSGGDNTLNRAVTRGTGDTPFHNVHGAAYRGVYDFADPDSSVFITSTGQSGHPLSRYYEDLGELWRRGEYVLMSLDPELARAASVGIMTLIPDSE